MIEYKDVENYINETYSTQDELVGLLTDILNGVCDPVELSAEIADFKEHNG